MEQLTVCCLSQVLSSSDDSLAGSPVNSTVRSGEDEWRGTSSLELHPAYSEGVQYRALMDGHVCELVQGDVLLFLE